MNVAQVRESLAAYPDDMEVVCFVQNRAVAPGNRIPEVLTGKVDRIDRMKLRSGQEVAGLMGMWPISAKKTGDTPESRE